MALKDRTRTERRPVIHGAPCSVGQLYRRNLDDLEEIVELHQVLYGDGLNAAEVLAEFATGGYDVARSAINKHRGGTCRCFAIDKDFCPICKQHRDAHTSCEQAA
jgi:hypothetical protein